MLLVGILVFPMRRLALRRALLSVLLAPMVCLCLWTHVVELCTIKKHKLSLCSTVRLSQRQRIT